jgi:hypothetical protein
MTRTTMMTMIRRVTTVFATGIITLSLCAQDNDFGIWYGANVKKGLFNKFSLEASGMMRTFENAAKVEQGFIEAGLAYKINKHLDTEISYRLTSALEDDSKYHFQHKAFADLKGDAKLSNFTFSGRLRFQTRVKTYLQKVSDKYPDYMGRIRLKALYRTPSFPLNPYIYYETFCPMFANSDRLIGKNRYSIGLEYKISGMHFVEIEYIYQRDYLPKLSDINIISLNYNLKL